MQTLLHCVRVICGLDEAATQVTPAELLILLEHSRDADVIVEIGTFEAKTAVELALRTQGHVYSIDPFFAGRLGVSYGRIIAHVTSRRRSVKNLTLIRGLSHVVAGSFDELIDFLFVDADHSYLGLQRDWTSWIPKMKVGAKVALHDVKLARNSPHRLGSMEFFESQVEGHPDFRQVAACDALVVIQKLR